VVNKNLDISDIDSDQACPICMEQWTSSGEHRLCCLRCGHLFGHSCILRWLQHSCNSTNRRCPQCNKKASVKHIRMLYAKKLTTIDTSEYDKLRKNLSDVSAEKIHLQEELSRYGIRQNVYEQQLACLKKRIVDLESQQSEINVHKSQNVSNLPTRKFHLEQSIEICKQGECRVLDYNQWNKILAVSQKSTNGLFNGYGIRKIDCEYFHLRQQFILLHNQPIRDMTFHSVQQDLLLSVGFDKCAKLLDIRNNITVHTYKAERSLWSCCWSGDNPYIFLTGTQNGSIMKFDIRQTSTAINLIESHDRSPVVSMATVPPNPGSGISRGGFIACHLNSCYTYEISDSRYTSKQVFLEGPFVSVRYDERNHHYLISSRPNARQSHARHIVCTIEKRSIEDIIMCNVVHTFQAGNSQQLLSRPCHLYAENDTLVAAHMESNSTISLWSVASGRQLHSLPVTDPIMDLCSFEVNNYLVLATLSKKRLRLYNYEQVVV